MPSIPSRSALAAIAALDQLGVDVSALRERAEALRGHGASAMHLAVEGRLSGLLAVSGPVKATTPETLKSLREAGLSVMATGDGSTTTRAVSQRLGIDEVHG